MPCRSTTSSRRSAITSASRRSWRSRSWFCCCSRMPVRRLSCAAGPTYAEDELALLHEQVEWLHDAQQPGRLTGRGHARQRHRRRRCRRGARAWLCGGRSRWPHPPASLRALPRSRLVPGSRRPPARVPPERSPRCPAPASAARGRSVVFGAPVGVGAPALSSATKLIPPTDEELRAVAAANAGPTAGAESANAATEAAAGRQGAVAAPPAPPPATAAAGGNGKPPRRAGIAADPGAIGWRSARLSRRRHLAAAQLRQRRRAIRWPALQAAGS